MMSDMVDISISGITAEQFERMLRRVTVSIANIHFNKQFTCDNIYEHIEFIDGNRTELDVNNMRLKEQ